MTAKDSEPFNQQHVCPLDHSENLQQYHTSRQLSQDTCCGLSVGEGSQPTGLQVGVCGVRVGDARGLFYTPAMPVRSDLSFADSLSGDHRRRFYEGHRSIALLMILIVFLSPFAGLYVTGLFGAVLGVLLSVAAYYLTPYLWLKLNG